MLVVVLIYMIACCTVLLFHHRAQLIVAEGWWDKNEVLQAPVVATALGKKFVINSVTYSGNSKTVITPAEDNWECIVGGWFRSDFVRVLHALCFFSS